MIDRDRMNPGITIFRYPYEEPYHLQLTMVVSNGHQVSRMDFYIDTDSLIELADTLEKFPDHIGHDFLWEVGSEVPEDRWAYYLRIRAFTLDSSGHCAVQFRWNNNQALPERVISDFCIEAESGQINRLGELLRKFAKLNHRVLEWCVSEGRLVENIDEMV